MGCILLISAQSFSQVTINYKDNKNIGGTFHIDGSGDNDITPTTVQIENDLFVDDAGRVGIGTITPEVALHIESNTANPIPLCIVDGGQANGKVLTSDANGVARWQNFGAIPVINIKLGAQKKMTVSEMSGKYLYTNTPITLPPGLWLIEVNILGMNSGATSTDFTSRIFVRTIIADTSSGQTTTKDSYGPGQTGRMAAGDVYLRGSGFNMINGYFIINNKSGQNKTYYYMAGNVSAYGSATASSTISFGGNNESTIFATYMDEARP